MAGVAVVLSLATSLYLAVVPPVDGLPARDRMQGTAGPAAVDELTSQNTPHVVPVLMYHALAPEAWGLHLSNELVITVEEFSRQMARLGAMGAYTPTMAEFEAWVLGEGPLPPRSVLITFDDGYESVREYAYPVLREHGFRAIIFIIGALVGDRTGEFDPWGYLSWDQLRAISDVFEVGNHTWNGHDWPQSGPLLEQWDQARTEEDFLRLAEAMREQGLPRPAAIAYPYGRSSSATLAAAQSQGLTVGFTIESGVATPGMEPLLLPRVPIYPGTDLAASLGASWRRLFRNQCVWSRTWHAGPRMLSACRPGS